MFSVITHQAPDDAELLLHMLHAGVRSGGQLYFTAFVDEKVETYVDVDSAIPCNRCTYHPEFLLALVERSGWDVSAIYAPAWFQQTVFVCRKRDT